MRECKRMECAGKAIHPAGYHRYDDAVQNTSEMRGIEKLFERFFDEVCNSILDYGDMPYPMEYDSDSDAIADFRDWYAMAVIRKLAKGI